MQGKQLFSKPLQPAAYEDYLTNVYFCFPPFPQQPTEYFDMGIFLAFFVVVSLVCLILLIKIKLKQRRSQVSLENTHSPPLELRCGQPTALESLLMIPL